MGSRYVLGINRVCVVVIVGLSVVVHPFLRDTPEQNKGSSNPWSVCFRFFSSHAAVAKVM